VLFLSLDRGHADGVRWRQNIRQADLHFNPGGGHQLDSTGSHVFTELQVKVVRTDNSRRYRNEDEAYSYM